MGNNKYCVVIRGRRPGVYKNWMLAEPHIRNLDKVAIYESFYSENEAQEVFDAAVAKGCVEEVHSESFDSASATFPLFAAWDPVDGPWGHEVVSNWHIVSRGLVPGIYPTWIDAAPQVKGVRGSKHASASSKQDAVEIYTELVDAGAITVLARRSAASSATYGSQAPVQSSRSASGYRNGNRTYQSISAPVKGIKREPTILFSPDCQRDRLSESFRGVNISGGHNALPARSYRTAEQNVSRDVRVERVDSYRQIQPLTQHRSWPATRPPSPEKRKDASRISRTRSENLDQVRTHKEAFAPGLLSSPIQRRQERDGNSRSSYSSSSEKRRTSGIVVGNPGHLKPFKPTVGSPSPSVPRSDMPSPNPRHSRTSTSSSYSSSKVNVATPPTISRRDMETESGRSFTEAQSPQTRRASSLSSSHQAYNSYQAPASDPGSSTNCFSLNVIGFGPSLSHCHEYGPRSDARSPLNVGTKGVPLPNMGSNSASFGRPSPGPYQSLVVFD